MPVRIRNLQDSVSFLRSEDEVEELVAVLADDRLLVSALNIVPLDAVLVEIVEHTDTALVVTALLLLPVVRLGTLQSTGLGPVAVATLARGRDPSTCGSPVPAVDNGRLQVLPVTSLEVALTTSCPDIRDIVPPDDAVDPVGLRLAVYRYTVHTESPAVIPGALPVPLPVQSLLQPGEVVGLAEPVSVDYSVFTSSGLW